MLGARASRLLEDPPQVSLALPVELVDDLGPVDMEKREPSVSFATARAISVFPQSG